MKITGYIDILCMLYDEGCKAIVYMISKRIYGSFIAIICALEQSYLTYIT